MRFPLYLTLILLLLSLRTAILMKDPVNGSTGEENKKATTGEAFRMTLETGKWILQTPFVLTIILFGMIFDGIVRVAITLTSQYYRVIDIPESLFGIIGAATSILGFIVPKIARKTAESKTPAFGLFLTALITISGLVGMNLFWPYAGIIPAIVAFSSMYFTGFFVSFYINRDTPSDTRATVLSFKGLLYNVSYGLLGVFYALVLKIEKASLNVHQTLSVQDLENKIFTDTFFWFPVTFVILFTGMVIIYKIGLKRKSSGVGEL